MRVLLCFEGEAKVTWLAEMQVLPWAGELLETGLQAWLVQEVIPTPGHSQHEAIIRMEIAAASLQPVRKHTLRVLSAPPEKGLAAGDAHRID